VDGHGTTTALAPYLDGVQAALVGEGFATTRELIAGRQAVVGYRSDFRWRWFAVRLETFVVAAGFASHEADRNSLDSYLDVCRSWAKAHRHGRPLGIQAGIATVAVAVLPETPGEARTWATTPHAHRFGVVAYPVTVDLSTGDVAHLQRMRTGRLFSGFLRGIAEDVLAAPFGPPRR
jgi:hypothetical protein